MPAAYTHEVVAKKVYKELDKPDYIKKNMGLFLLGSQGPNPLYYHKKQNPFSISPLHIIASHIHYKNHSSFLVDMVKEAKGKPELMVYVQGFLTHYATDREIHPFVEAKTQKPGGGSDVIKHHEFESILDTWIHKHEDNVGIPRQCLFLDTLIEPKLKLVAQFFANCATSTFDNNELKDKDVFNAIIHMKKITKKIYYKDNSEYAKFQNMEKLLGKKGEITCYIPSPVIPGYDIFNMSHHTWKVPWEFKTPRNENIMDLINKSVKLSLEIIDAANVYWLSDSDITEFEEAVKYINFNGKKIS